MPIVVVFATPILAFSIRVAERQGIKESSDGVITFLIIMSSDTRRYYGESSRSMCYVCGGESGVTLKSALLVLWLPSRAYSSTSPNPAARFCSCSRPNPAWIPSFKVHKACSATFQK